MAEQLDLTAPIVPPSRTFYRVSQITFNWDAATIRLELIGSEGTVVYASYEGAIATSLMQGLNTANNSVTSLNKRIFNRLVADGKLPAGTVSGTP